MFVHLILAVSSQPAITDSQLTADKTNLQLSFSWTPAISDCPTAYYHVLSSNCGSCPIATTDTSAICTNAPSCGLCILAVQTVINDYAVKDILNDPVYISLNRTRNCIQIGSNNSDISTGPGKKLSISYQCHPHTR